jgi:hypothetical protein
MTSKARCGYLQSLHLALEAQGIFKGSWEVNGTHLWQCLRGQFLYSGNDTECISTMEWGSITSSLRPRALHRHPIFKIYNYIMWKATQNTVFEHITQPCTSFVPRFLLLWNRRGFCKETCGVQGHAGPWWMFSDIMVTMKSEVAL